MNTKEAPIVDVSLLANMRQEALSIADRCRKILQENFGANRVILFGSLVGDSPWHRDSVQLDEYRRFRHLVHHRYNTDLKADLVLELATRVPPTLAAIRQTVGVFQQWLDDRASEAPVE